MCSLLWVVLRVWLVSVPTDHTAKASTEGRGFFVSRSRKAAGRWTTGGEDYKYRRKHPCFAQGLAAIEMRVRTGENLQEVNIE